MDNRTVGVFDSGLGGLTVVKEIKKLLPNERIIYLGDTARVPYGTRSKDAVVKFVLQDARFLIRKNVKCIVIACNTASSQACKELRRSVKVPVIDVVTSGVRAATSSKKDKKIGVIATNGTVNSRAYSKAISSLRNNLQVIEKACPLLVPLIEEGEVGKELVSLLLSKYLSSLKKEALDTLVLGCTHYPILYDQISEFMGDSVEVINSGEQVAKDLKGLLTSKSLQSKNKKPKYTYYVTDLTKNFEKMANMFMGESVGEIRKVEL